MTKISTTLTNEVDLKLKRLSQLDGYHLKRANSYKKALKNTGDLYSIWLEYPEQRRALLGDDVDPKKVRRIAKEGLKDIQRAWSYLISSGKHLKEEIDRNLILSVGTKIEPGNFGFRSISVTLGLREYTPPNPIKIDQLIEKLVYEVKSSTAHPLELAAYMHLKIAGIQPFQDGNKRTARLFQDKLLKDHELPPAVIPSGERIVYIDLLEDALAGDRDQDTKRQRNFFDYIGCKVNYALDEMIDDLKL